MNQKVLSGILLADLQLVYIRYKVYIRKVSCLHNLIANVPLPVNSVPGDPKL